MCGTPVIVSEKCGMAQIVREAGIGWTVPYGDQDALSKALTNALSDQERAGTLVKNGQTYIRANLSWDRIITQIEGFYQQCY
jgi:glycosyltransferase involved in cell wall biosynthesis